MMEDDELLRRYVDSGSEMDFTVLVERHLALVYQAALRRMDGRSDLAQDVTQHVFTTLAREAPKLVSHPALVGWLFTATRHAAGHFLRTERRRLEREQEAFVRNALENSGPDANWEEIRDQLDEVMDKLGEQDRTVILLRYFNNQAFAQIGNTFDLSEDAARKRVDRALERLRGLLAKRGVTSTAAALGVMLTSQAASAAPTGLAQTIASSALLPGATASLPASGLFYFMNTKIVLSVAGTLGLAGLLSLPPVGLALYERHDAARAETIANLARQENAERTAELNKLQERTREADQKTAALKAELGRLLQAVAASTKTARPAAAPPRSKGEADALADGEAFLASFPQAGQMLIELARAQVRANFTGFYRSAQLTPAQIEELETRTAEFWNKSIALTPDGVRPLVAQLPDDQLQQILGEENFQRFQDFKRAKYAHGITGRIELVAGYASTPLSLEQSQQLVQMILGNSADYKSGRSLKIEAVDWPTVSANAQKIVSPEQWKAIHPVFLQMQFQATVEKAQQEASAVEQPKT